MCPVTAIKEQSKSRVVTVFDCNLYQHLSALSQHPVTDKQSAGFSKLVSDSVHSASADVSLPAISSEQLELWQGQTSAFTLSVNTTLPAVPCLSHSSFCNSALDRGHLLIDLFGLSRSHCQSIMVHYKLLKRQAPTLSAHFLIPSAKHTWQPGVYKPPGLMMQTCQQFTRGRKSAVLLYNPPLVQRHAASLNNDSSGLTAVFQVCLAGMPARVLVDTGAEVSFVDTSFAKRIGLHISPPLQDSPSIQLANGEQSLIRSRLSPHADSYL